MPEQYSMYLLPRFLFILDKYTNESNIELSKNAFSQGQNRLGEIGYPLKARCSSSDYRQHPKTERSTIKHFLEIRL